MHERTQRATARLMFVFCCAIPTMATCICVLVTWTPWYHARVLHSLESGLARDTGLVVEIDDFQRSTPSTLHLMGVRLLDPETLREVARVRELQWVSESDEVSILLQQPEVQSSQLEFAWRLIHDRFLCRPERTSLPVQVACNDLTIHSRTGALTLRDVDAWVRPHEDTIEASIQCLPAIARSQSPINITVRRQRGGESLSTEWSLSTGGTALPCSALAEYWTPLEKLGSDAMFSGNMSWKTQEDQWSIDLGGSRIQNVSLDRLFGEHAHRLSGSADITLERCRVEPHLRRSDIVGTIVAKDGLVGRSLLRQASEHLGFEVQIPENLLDTSSDVHYDQLALGFNITNTQLTLQGICRPPEIGYEQLGVVLCLNGYPLVHSSGSTLESLRVITAIAPAHSVPVPLSKQTNWLTNILIPPSRPLPLQENYPRIGELERSQGGPAISQPR